jgi:hypothetical protein
MLGEGDTRVLDRNLTEYLAAGRWNIWQKDSNINKREQKNSGSELILIFALFFPVL